MEDVYPGDIHLTQTKYRLNSKDSNIISAEALTPNPWKLYTDFLEEFDFI